MSVQKILPLARKMGEENFIIYKNFYKNSKIFNGKNNTATLNLKGFNIMDTVSITLKDKEKLPKGFMELINEIYKKYFPRSASNDAKKTVILSSQKFNKEHFNSSIVSVTEDKNGVFAHGFLRFEKNKNDITANLESSCEDVLFRLVTNIKLPKFSTNGRYNIDLKPTKNILFEQKDNRTKISISSNPTKEVPFLGIQLEAPNKMLESIFGGELEDALPELIKKTGFMI